MLCLPDTCKRVTFSSMVQLYRTRRGALLRGTMFRMHALFYWYRLCIAHQRVHLTPRAKSTDAETLLFRSKCEASIAYNVRIYCVEFVNRRQQFMYTTEQVAIFAK